MKLGVVKKVFALLLSGAALFLALGAGCNEQENEDNDRPGVENTEDNEQDDEEGEDGGG